MEKEFDVADVFHQLQTEQASRQNNVLETPWWHLHVIEPQRNNTNSLDVTLDSILFLALKASKQIQIAAAEPIIQETRIDEADSRFDWVRYLNTSWDDTSDPIGNSLTAGGNVTRLNEHFLSAGIGTRRLTRRGGQLDVGQTMGFRNSNSTFINPNNQANSRMTISYTHPLRRGNGYEYNNALVLLATTDSEIAFDQFTTNLQNHLLEIITAYWRLYQDRAVLSQRVRLYLKTKQLVSILKAREKIDANGTQLITASAALENRRADLIRASTSVKNSETILRGLISAADLGEANLIELIPIESPQVHFVSADLKNEVQMALRMRPEARAALRQVKAGSVLLNVAKHEIMPALNLVTQAYLTGLRGDADFLGALGDQVSEGSPGYSLGIQYELPFGNRRAHAQMTRRQVELRRLKLQYRQTLETIRTEVDIAVREANTAYYETMAKQRALAAANAEAETIEVRWNQMIDGSSQASLNLESLLRAQERVGEAEAELANAVFVYNLALVGLKRANGTFLQSEQITIDRVNELDGPKYVLGKGVQQAVYLEALEQKEPDIDPVDLLKDLEPILIPSTSDMQTIPDQIPADQPSLYSVDALSPYILESPDRAPSRPTRQGMPDPAYFDQQTADEAWEAISPSDYPLNPNGNKIPQAEIITRPFHPDLKPTEDLQLFETPTQPDTPEAPPNTNRSVPSPYQLQPPSSNEFQEAGDYQTIIDSANLNHQESNRKPFKREPLYGRQLSELKVESHRRYQLPDRIDNQTWKHPIKNAIPDSGRIARQNATPYQLSGPNREKSPQRESVEAPPKSNRQFQFGSPRKREFR